jgi:transmembrane sensor
MNFTFPMDKKKLENILPKYLNGSATLQESILIEIWYNSFEESDTPELDEKKISGATERIADRLGLSSAASFSSWPWFGLAASILLVTSFVFLYYKNGNDHTELGGVRQTSQEINPRFSGAKLKLQGGKEILVSKAEAGVLINENGIEILKTAAGDLIYNQSGKNPTFGINSLTTSRGAQIKVTLSDGSQVYLNSASTFRFPALFKADSPRMVELLGEGYFEVAKDIKRPFVVNSNKQVIEVLGTHFNINSYKDEGLIKTTLLEGSIRLMDRTDHDRKIILKPGDQAVFSSASLIVNAVDTRYAVDWKDGKFMFSNEKLSSILRRIARWYNIKIVYQGHLAAEPTFTGAVSKAENISKVLEMLEGTSKVKFQLKDDTLFVTQVK